MIKYKKNDCKDCNGKGFYTQIFGLHYAADFEGDKSVTTKSKIHKIACAKCNYQNKRRLKDIQKTQWIK